MKARNHDRSPDKKGFSVALPKSLLADVERIARIEHRSRNGQIEHFLYAAVEQWEEQNNTSKKTSTRPSIVSFPPVPLIRAAAGVPILADAEHVEPDCNLGEGRFMLELRGDSMEPLFRHKQRVVLRDKSTLKRPVLKYGEFYCFVHDGAATFKQWAKDDKGRKVLRSLNSEYPDIPADDQTDWIGWFDKADNK